MERLMKPFRLRSSKDRKPLSEEQKRKRAKFVVYPLMFLLCLGSFYLYSHLPGRNGSGRIKDRDSIRKSLLPRTAAWKETRRMPMKRL